MPRTNMRDLTFATMNLLNLQAPGGLTYSSTPPFPDDAEGRAAYRRKVAWIGAKIAQVEAEVIAFQEVWDADALRACFDAAGLTDTYDIVARDAPGRGRPQVALAVARDRNGGSQLIEADWHAEFPDTFRFDGIRESDGAQEEVTITINAFSRPLLIARIQPEGTSPRPPEVTIVCAHLKSKGPARVSFARPRPVVLQEHAARAKSALSHIRRVMEAGALRVLLDERMSATDEAPLSPVVVLGDLNDDTSSVTTELISDQPTYRVIEKSTAGRQADKGLYSVERLQQYRSLRHVYYTHIYQNKRESLDHILVSEEFYDHSRKRLWSFREMEVINDHLNREDYEEALGASDHGIVRAYFDWNPMPDEIG
ncbi:hypothetical protein ATO8_14277 [Roseivivax marinus]|uniref:Endonuclease/exonuclease/phosphatase domain-containing protein n=1 Tax=Roseivivax marinus TaxID=1379903 RepID=W4HIM3_9RHOB|nr:endonuclease/exonuclease/phosphatase family protein [Roseivivax marinus]ETW11840.1 hypothetical protein ATO8_14277 [Roseivivax marinus]